MQVFINLTRHTNHVNLLTEVNENMKSFLKDKRAAGGVIVALISMMVMILVGIIVVNALINSQVPDTTWSLKANQTWAMSKLTFG